MAQNPISPLDSNQWNNLIIMSTNIPKKKTTDNINKTFGFSQSFLGYFFIK